MNKLPSPKIIAGLLTAGILLVLSASLIYILYGGHTSPTKHRDCIADIYQNGTLIQSVLLSAETQNRTFTIETVSQEFNTIEVTHGAIRISSASCPDKICVHQGWISDSLLPITCLPNHLVIQIRYSNQDQPDGITY